MTAETTWAARLEKYTMYNDNSGRKEGDIRE